MISKGLYITEQSEKSTVPQKIVSFLYISPYNIRIISQKCPTAKYFFREALIFGENGIFVILFFFFRKLIPEKSSFLFLLDQKYEILSVITVIRI